MRKLIYCPAARADLDGIYEWIEPNNPHRAASFVQDIRTRCRILLEHPKLGPARGNIKSGLRYYPMFGRVVVCYRLAGNNVVKTRVFYGGQDYTAIMHRDNES